MTTTSTTVLTRDVDHAREAVGGLFCSHRLIPASGRSVRLDLRAHRVADIGLVDLDYGAAVQIDPGALDDFYLVQVPLRGRALIRQAGEELVSSRAVASVLSPGLPLTMAWGASTPQTIVYLSRAAVERQLARLLGHPVTGPVRFDVAMRMSDDGVRAWRRTTEFLHQELRRGNPLFADPRQAATVEEMVAGQLLAVQPHTYSAQLRQGTAAPGSVVRDACALMAGHLAEPLTVADVAEAVGISVRSLQEGFQRELGCTPTTWLREHRLLACRVALQAASPARQTVTEVATGHGFWHLGRFSVEYKRRFGESPKQTLAR